MQKCKEKKERNDKSFHSQMPTKNYRRNDEMDNIFQLQK